MCRFCVGKEKGKSPFGDLNTWGLHALMQANIDSMEKLKSFIASGYRLSSIRQLGKVSAKEINKLLK